jgi:hypothetical protein
MRTATRTAGVLPGAPAVAAVGNEVDDGGPAVDDDAATVVAGVIDSADPGDDRLLENDRMMNRWSGRDLEGSTAFSPGAGSCGNDVGGLTYVA